MAVLLKSHLCAEADFLYDAERGESQGAFAEALSSFAGTFVELDADWHAYLSDWTVDAITADRSGFIAATSDMMTALQLRIAHENDMLYPLAVESGRIALRAER